QPPRPTFPALVLVARDLAGKIEAFEPGPFPRPLEQRRNIELALLVVGDHRVRRAAGADAAGQRAGIDSPEADFAVLRHPLNELALGAEARMARHFLAHHAADRAFDERLDILRIGSDVA